MPTDSSLLTAYTNDDLAALCAQQSSRVNPADTEPSACYELFRRACTSPFDNAAWQAVYVQYTRLVQSWLGQYAGEDALQETFLRFF